MKSRKPGSSSSPDRRRTAPHAARGPKSPKPKSSDARGGARNGGDRPSRGPSDRPARPGSERPSRGPAERPSRPGSERPSRGPAERGPRAAQERNARGQYTSPDRAEAPRRNNRADYSTPVERAPRPPARRNYEEAPSAEYQAPAPRAGRGGYQSAAERASGAPPQQGRRTSEPREGGRPPRYQEPLEAQAPRPRREPAEAPEGPAPLIRSFSEERVFGRHTVLEHLRSKTPINRLYVLTSAQGLNREFFELAQEQGIPVVRHQKDRLDFLANGGNHQGIVAQLGARAFSTPQEVVELFLAKGQTGLLLVLSGVQDPGNLGAILRTAEGAGVHGVLLSSRDSCGLTPTVSKVSAGADAHIPIARAERPERYVEALKSQGIQIVTTLPNAEMPYHKVNYQRPTVIILGSEGEGVEGRLNKVSTQRVSIPMLGKMESLNVSAATAVLLYEVVRQRGQKAPAQVSQ